MDEVEVEVEESECAHNEFVGEIDLFPNSKTFISHIDSVKTIIYTHNNEEVVFTKRVIINNDHRFSVCDDIIVSLAKTLH